MISRNEPPSSAWRARILLVIQFAIVGISTNQLDYDADHQQIVEGAGDILSYYAMSEAAPQLVSQRVPYHHAQRIFLPYTLGLVHHATGLSIQTVYLVAGTLMLLGALWFFIRSCGLLAFTESTQVLVGSIVVFNPYVFRHLIMFNGYVNDIGFLLGVSLGLFFVLRRRRGCLLVAIILAALSRQTTLLTVPCWLLLDYLADRTRTKILDGLSISYVVVPVLIYVATARVGAHSGLPSETRSALLGLFDWMQSSFSIGRLASFAIRGVIPFAFLVAIAWGLRRRGAMDRAERQLAWGFLFLVWMICLQPVLGGPDWTTNSIARLNALAVFPAALAVGLMIQRTVETVHVSVFCTVGTLIAIGSIHHIYTFNGTFSADKNMWFAAVHFVSAAIAGVVLRFPSKPDAPARDTAQATRK